MTPLAIFGSEVCYGINVLLSPKKKTPKKKSDTRRVLIVLSRHIEGGG
jgi:hypothetical protein